MRLLQLMAGARTGGAEKFFERLAVSLAAAGVTQHLLIRENPMRIQRLEQQGLKVSAAPFGGMFDFRTTTLIRRTVRTFQPDVVLTWMNRASRHCPKLDVPVVARLGGYYDLKYYKRADALIGNTPDLVRYFQANGWPPEKTQLLSNFASTPPNFSPLVFPETGIVRLLAMGRLHPNKGFDTLLDALALLPERFTLTLAGSGSEGENLQKQAARLGLTSRITFTGWQENTDALWQDAHLFICPSRHEPLGNVLLEAMARGMPLVSTNTDGARYLLNKILPLVPIDDAANLAHAIQHVDPRHGRDIQQHYNTFHSEKVIVAAYVAYLQTLQQQ